MADLFLERDAVISDCGLYRYLLRRTWNYDRPRALFIMLNPSTADAEIDDPTIKSCARLMRGLDYGSFEVVNLVGLRATNPSELASAEDPGGRGNDGIAQAAINRCDIIICAWGANSFAAARTHRGRTMVGMACSQRPAVFCFGRTKAGHPKHPLYIKTGTPLEVYRP